MQRARGLFITGNDTGVGKTYATALIARALAAGGHKVGVYKPVASGCRREGGRLICDDAVALWEAAGRPGELGRVCPQQFEAAIAPPMAAREEGKQVNEELLRSGLDYWTLRSEIVLVEGAGGLMSPITDSEYVADLAYDFRYPLIVVARNQLGVINQTLQTLIVAMTFRHGLDVAGVVLDQGAPPSSDASVATNREELQSRCVPPVLAEVAWQGGFDREVDWASLAK